MLISSLSGSGSALGDLSFEYSPNSFWTMPNRRTVFIRNNNTSQAVVASVVFDSADGNFSVHSLDGARTKNYFPQQFQVRIPPGLRWRVGEDQVEFCTNGNGVGTYRIFGATFTVTGASYAPNVPIPIPAPADIEDHVVMYTAPIDDGNLHGELTWVMNMHRVWGIVVSAKSIPASAMGTFEFEHKPGGYQVVFDSRGCHPSIGLTWQLWGRNYYFDPN